MKIAVFCGSSTGHNPLFAESAAALGKLLVADGHQLVYGGGQTGLMGVVADSVLAAGGEVYGVMPEALVNREIQHPGLTGLEVVADISTRKARMARMADAFVALPGGMGTLEEISEVWTAGQLGYHSKPCGFLNVADFYTPLLDFITHVVEQGFMHEDYARMAQVSADPAELLSLLLAYQPPRAKWS